jgi:hypothetical protein
MAEQWAYDRVRQLVDAQTKPGWHDNHTPSGVANAFARYIAEHEDEPEDPLLDEVQNLADELRINLSAMPWAEKALLAALRRGIEIGKAQA